ncbi:MAG: type II toxin-antitoxin system VapC family toxin [Myxococcales bacterium]|nr:type II toxin-antitoxin system VapC family toxin [Myxococcales bacterium]
MIVPDLNLLLYAHHSAFREHPRALVWWRDLLEGGDEIGITMPVLFGFIRLSTKPRMVDPPMPLEVALSCVEMWIDRPLVRLLQPGPRHLAIAFQLLRTMGAAGDLSTDVQIAALAIENQAELHSNDRDFGRFRGLRWVNPLEEE